MDCLPPPKGLSPADYEAIEQAVQETARGRWFLSEYARRQRAEETQALLDALGRIEAKMAAPAPQLAPASPGGRLSALRAAEIGERLFDALWLLNSGGFDEAEQARGEIEAQARALLAWPQERQGRQEPTAAETLVPPAARIEIEAQPAPAAAEAPQNPAASPPVAPLSLASPSVVSARAAATTVEARRFAPS